MDKAFRNLNLFRSFECAARHNSYSKAATELCISQAAVSQQMRQLEAYLNSQLFIRKHKEMLLTAEGKSLQEATQKALSILQQGINDVRNEPIEGKLTITSTQAFVSLWLMPRLNKFLERHPGIEISVLSSASFEDLKEQHIDLAIRFGLNVEKFTDKSLVCQYFGEDEVYPVCSVNLVEQLAIEQPSDLLNAWLIELEKPGAYDWASWFNLAQVTNCESHQYWTKVHSTDMALSAVLNGHGFALIARYLCAEQLNSGALVVPVDLPHPNKVKRYFVYDPQSAKRERLKVFMQWLEQEMATEMRNNQG